MNRDEWAASIADEWQKLTADRPSTEGTLSTGITYRLGYAEGGRLGLTQPIFLSGKALTFRMLVANRLVVAYTLPGSIHFRAEIESFLADAIAEADRKLSYMRLQLSRWDAAAQEKEIPE